MGRYDAVIPWHVLKAHLERQLEQTDKMLRRATSDDSPVLRGRAVLLEELLNLPESLETIALEDDRVAAEKK